MDSGLVRLLIVAALFLLLAGDYGSILSHLSGVFGEAEGEAESTPETEESAQLVLKDTGRAARAQLLDIMKNSCLPKLICELNATPQKEKLSEAEKALLSLISDTTISTTAEVTSKYHFAAHMGQLINGVDGAGCHNFYPSCPFPGVQVLNMIKSIRLRQPS
uniref:Uncharacterized protein n=3 Tax=Cuerna arida TaxID=1464854 RepID=A0A1B6GCZ0_9HEMI